MEAGRHSEDQLEARSMCPLIKTRSLEEAKGYSKGRVTAGED